MTNNDTLILETADILPIIKEAVNNGKGFVLTVTGQSMRPTLKNLTDKVELASLPENIKKGDLLFFERESGACVLHRVVKVENDRFVVSGDSQKWTETLNKDKAIAVVSKVYRNGRWIDCDSFCYKVADFVRRISKPTRLFLRSIRRKLKNKK